MEVSVTKAAAPDGSSVWILRYVGDGDPTAALDEFESALPEGRVRLDCDPSDPAVRVILATAEGGDQALDNTISMELRTPMSTIRSSELKVSDRELDTMIALSRNFHRDDSAFEMWTDTGFVVVPPDVARNSILTINITKDEDEVQDV